MRVFVQLFHGTFRSDEKQQAHSIGSCSSVYLSAQNECPTEPTPLNLGTFSWHNKNCLTNSCISGYQIDLLQWEIWPKSAWSWSSCTLFENSRIADPYESNDFRRQSQAKNRSQSNKEYWFCRCTKKVAADDRDYSEESLRALFLGALAHDLLTLLPSLFHWCFRDNLFHGFLTLEYRALSFRIFLSFTP